MIKVEVTKFDAAGDRVTVSRVDTLATYMVTVDACNQPKLTEALRFVCESDSCVYPSDWPSANGWD